MQHRWFEPFPFSLLDVACKMMMRFRLSFVGLLSLCLVLGCAESTDEAPPVMQAMDSLEELQEEAEAAELARLRKQAAERNVPSSDGSMATATASLPIPANVPTTGKFVVDFESTAGPFTIEVDRSWSPVGAQRFYELVKDGFYDQAGFFRVVPGFMVQFGLAADPKMTAKWRKEIQDDPVVESNKRGFVTFAKTGRPNSRTGQIFINYTDNSFLDADGFSPFGKVIKGMESVDQINSEYREQPNQGSLTSRGNEYLKSQFPNLDYVTKATVVVDDLEATSDASGDAEK